MKEVFKPKKFRGDSACVVRDAVRVSEEYMDKGYSVTVRQLYYQMVAQDLFPDSWIDSNYNSKNGLPYDTKNTIKNYQRFVKLVSEARLAGFIDWNAIEDRMRRTIRNTHWSDHEEILRSAVRSWSMDKWDNQWARVEVMCEKDAVSGILEPICRMHDVPFTACRGYGSQSLFYNKGKEFRRVLTKGKPVIVLYFGDHDPSGLDMDRDVITRVREFCRLNGNFNRVQLLRLGLTMKQVREINPPPNPAKSTDSRYRAYRDEFGDDSWELDALPPEYLENILESAILEIRDDSMWEKALCKENEMRLALMERVGLTEGDMNE